ncbi:MAG: cobalamin biosynthesis protein CbiA [candidate division WOR-3 bacterium]|nr:MAG: cobalamin biosynthesis protein CbiA [candidate division WOR-3 bacterium]
MPVTRWIGAEALLAGLKRVNVFCGGYGSGKTEVAVNFALHLSEEGRKVRIADLDIVNPYFRSREVRAALRARGIEVLVPEERLVNADLPIVSPEVKGALESGDQSVVLDLGGDPAGARVMASLSGGWEDGDYDGLLVVNSRRPFTGTADAVVKVIADIEAASGMRIGKLVVNSHLIDQTDRAVIEEGIRLAEEATGSSAATIAFVAVERRTLEDFDAEGCGYPVMVLDRMMLKPWENVGSPGSDRFRH